MTPEADDRLARRDAYRARRQAESRRTVAKVYIGVAVVWVLIAVLWWLNDDADPMVRWLNTVVAVGSVGVATLHWRKFLRRPPSPE